MTEYENCHSFSFLFAINKLYFCMYGTVTLPLRNQHPTGMLVCMFLSQHNDLCNRCFKFWDKIWWHTLVKYKISYFVIIIYMTTVKRQCDIWRKKSKPIWIRPESRNNHLIISVQKETLSQLHNLLVKEFTKSCIIL